MPFRLESTAFLTGERIPRRFTCDGEDVRPPLVWSDPPAGTRELALLVDDPEAPGGAFLHYVAWGISPELRRLPEGVVAPAEGRNAFGSVGWRGPCPPRGPEHHYVFRLYALSRPIDAEPGARRAEIESQIAERTIGEAQLVGRYGRG